MTHIHIHPHAFPCLKSRIDSLSQPCAKCQHWSQTCPSSVKVLLQYTRDGDENGVFSYLGTRGKSQAWQNPMTTGQCNVMFLPHLSGGKPEYVVARSSLLSNGYIAGQDGSSVTLDISPSQLCPTHYTIRNAPIDPQYALRNWVFEGSTGDALWTVLTTHTDDESLETTTTAIATFAVPPQQEYFSSFRLRVTGQCASGHNHLVLGSVEMYGRFQK